MKIVKKDLVIEHEGAKFKVKPRNVETSRRVSQAETEKDLFWFFVTLVTGWEGVVDDEGNAVEFSKENIAFLPAVGVEEVSKKIMEAYGMEINEEKN